MKTTPRTHLWPHQCVKLGPRTVYKTARPRPRGRPRQCAQAFTHLYALLSYRFSRRIASQLQNWVLLTYLHGKPRNTYIYLMQESQNVSNTSRHQEVVVSLLNLPCYSHFSCLDLIHFSPRKFLQNLLFIFSKFSSELLEIFSKFLETSPDIL